ncbi:MAG TPA: protein-methionine-sulfoxide reductase heme-binding subunit MsrQ [Steroidobacteraceae bacterium]|nr:protein-methionine-sulfoxide reductase heme-binding subunit MsrQ [Steroidobacteraceae bacterium]
MPAGRNAAIGARALRVAVFLLCLLPALRLTAAAFGVAGFSLGANPVSALLRACGHWGLNFLLITLCMTPLTDLSGSQWPLRLRRMMGLFTFFYLSLHLLVYVVLDQDRDLGAVWRDVVKRPYITIGFAAFLLLIPLALTSTRRAMRRLGRRWARLHRLIYPIAVLGVWHYWWQVKRDIREPFLYACALAILFGYRLAVRQRGAARLSSALLAERDGV